MRGLHRALRLGLVASALSGSACEGRLAQPRNVALIIVDTLRADHLGAWGYPVATSPELDAVALRGVRFTRYFSNSPWTRPGVATLMTGLYPRSTGIFEERYDVLPEDLETLPEILAAFDYVTLGVTANPNVNAWFGFGQGFREYVDSTVVWPIMPAREGQRRFERGVNDLLVAEEITDRSLGLIDRHRELLTRSPFYLQVLYVDPHRPYQAPAPLVDAMREQGSRVPDYDAEIRRVDGAVRELLDGLADRGLLKDTLVLITADHGEGLGDHPGIPFSTGHGSTLYDSLLHVPLIAVHPTLETGLEVDALVSSIDVAPTILDWVGHPEFGTALPGRSLVPLMRGRPDPDPREWLFAETDWRVNRKTAVRTRDAKYIRNYDSALFQEEQAYEGRRFDESVRRLLTRVPPEELYALEESRPEHPNRSRIGAGGTEKHRLLRLLEEWESRTPARQPVNRDTRDVLTLRDGREVPTHPGGTVELPDAEVESRLRALGYLTD